MRGSPVSEFSVKMNCRLYFYEYPVWVRKTTFEGKNYYFVNGCENCNGSKECSECISAVYQKVTQDDLLP